MLLRALEGRQTRRIGEAAFRPSYWRCTGPASISTPGVWYAVGYASIIVMSAEP